LKELIGDHQHHLQMQFHWLLEGGVVNDLEIVGLLEDERKEFFQQLKMTFLAHQK
jgi:acyl-CoA thioesterase FadM